MRSIAKRLVLYRLALSTGWARSYKDASQESTAQSHCCPV